MKKPIVPNAAQFPPGLYFRLLSAGNLWSFDLKRQCRCDSKEFVKTYRFNLID